MIIEKYILLRDHLELLNAPPAVLGYIDVAFGVDGDPMRLVELAGEVARAAEAGKDLSAFAFDDLDLGIVLVDQEDLPRPRSGEPFRR